MKSVALLLVFAFLQVTSRSVSEQTLPLDTEQEECVKELKADRQTMARLSAEQFPPENNSAFNDFFSCVWKKQGYQHQNGGINYDALEKMLFDALKGQAGTSNSAISLARKMATTAINDCKTITGRSPGQVAVKIQNCLYRKMMQFSEE